MSKRAHSIQSTTESWQRVQYAHGRMIAPQYFIPCWMLRSPRDSVRPAWDKSESTGHPLHALGFATIGGVQPSLFFFLLNRGGEGVSCIHYLLNMGTITFQHDTCGYTQCMRSIVTPGWLVHALPRYSRDSHITVSEMRLFVCFPVLVRGEQTSLAHTLSKLMKKSSLQTV